MVIYCILTGLLVYYIALWPVSYTHLRIDVLTVGVVADNQYFRLFGVINVQ